MDTKVSEWLRAVPSPAARAYSRLCSRVSSAVSSAHKWQNYQENIEHGFCLQPMLLCIHLGPRMAFALLFIRTKGLEHSDHPSVGKEFLTVAFLWNGIQGGH